MLIYSHRGNINGKAPDKENSISYLADAISRNLNVEFDINFTVDKTKLVLSHDENESTKENEVDKFLSTIKTPQFHALNIKNPHSIIDILEKIRNNNIQSYCFLFDFELVIPNISEARFVMKSIQKQGFNVAYRLSENEKYYDAYLKNEDVKLLWMDEFSIPWIDNSQVLELKQAGKQTIYVSPDLHGEKDITIIRKRWGNMIESGISGICTDYPHELRIFIEQTL